MPSPRREYKREYKKDYEKDKRRDYSRHKDYYEDVNYDERSSYKGRDSYRSKDHKRDYHHDYKKDYRRDTNKKEREREISRELRLKNEISEKVKSLVDEKNKTIEKDDHPITTFPSESKPRKRKSRWSSEFDRVLIPGLPVALAGIDMTKEQQELYVMQLKVEEISLKLRTGNLGIPPNPEDRSPSPEPAYNTQGVRLNTREIRVRQKLEEERHALVAILSEKNSEYRPPPDYKIPANKLTDKVFIPQDRYPDINFIGLLIGPRGNTLKRLETDTNCKIIIRGKGSLKEGKARLAPMPGEDEPLHALITAPSEQCLAKGISTIKRIIKDGIDNPGGSNELRQTQLRELAELNGTMLAAEIARCRNCGSTEHRHWECTETVNFTNMLICSKCGGAGHLVQDCIYDGEKVITAEEKAKMDEEYQSLMKELGVSAVNQQFPQMMGLPKAMVNDLPWANSSGTFLNSTTEPNAFKLGQSGPLAITNSAYNTMDPELAAEIPYCPGVAPMPSHTVRTLLLQGDQSGNPPEQPAMPPGVWPAYPGYAYPPYNPMQAMPMYPPGYYPPTHVPPVPNIPAMPTSIPSTTSSTSTNMVPSSASNNV